MERRGGWRFPRLLRRARGNSGSLGRIERTTGLKSRIQDIFQTTGTNISA